MNPSNKIPYLWDKRKSSDRNESQTPITTWTSTSACLIAELWWDFVSKQISWFGIILHFELKIEVICFFWLPITWPFGLADSSKNLCQWSTLSWSCKDSDVYPHIHNVFIAFSLSLSRNPILMNQMNVKHRHCRKIYSFPYEI